MRAEAIILFLFVIQEVKGRSFIKVPVPPVRSIINANLEGKQIPHETQCNLYYRYVYGVKIIKECADEKLFNTQISNCDYNYNVDCGNRKSPVENTIPDDFVYEYYDIEETNSDYLNGEEYSVTTIRSSECPTKEDPYEPNSLLAHEDSCNHFYKCIDGNKHLMKCSGILQFNPKISVCDWPSKVRCSKNWRSSSTTETSTTTKENTVTGLLISRDA